MSGGNMVQGILISGYRNIRIRLDIKDFMGVALNIAVSNSSDPPIFFCPLP